MKHWLWYLIGIIVLILLVKQCEGDTKTITKTVIKYVPVTEIIKETVIDTVFKKVYIERLKTVKGKDSIIYKDKPSNSTISANQYNTTLLSNNASAELKITTTGELIDVIGTINYKQKETNTEILKIRDASGLFIYGGSNIQKFQPEIGVLFQFKNKVFINLGVELDNMKREANLKAGFGVRLF